MSSVWPELRLADWQPTYETLHRWTQIVGKTRLALAPMQNHWWNVTLYVTSRGLTTSPMPFDGKTVEICFDFIDHTLIATTSSGDVERFKLEPQSVADFYDKYMVMLRSIGVDVKIHAAPTEIEDATPFAIDRSHSSYDAGAAERCWSALVQADRIFKSFRGRFIGKSSPVHFWWGSFDLACTRFSGRSAPRHPGGVPNCPDYVMLEAYSHECISAGWWPGSYGVDAAFYAYAYPEPPGFAEASMQRTGAGYNTDMHDWILPYEDVRTNSDPDAVILDFLQTTYETAATAAGWDRAALERN